MSADNRIKAISFDGDMTLWDFVKVMRHSLSIALTELQRRVPGPASQNLTIDKMIDIRNAVGAVSVWLNRDRKPNDTNTVPDYEIASLTEILAIVSPYLEKVTELGRIRG